MTIAEEIGEIRRLHRGVIDPVDVVEYARNPETELHRHFEWDDSAAAEEYRLWQARHIIARVTVIPSEDIGPVRAYVSLVSDRVKGGGYRAIENVFRNPRMREELLDRAMAEAEAWHKRYEQLTELSPIFAGIEQVKSVRCARSAAC